MIDTDKYEDAKKMVQDAGLIDENDGHPDIHYRKIAMLLAEVKRLDFQLDGKFDEGLKWIEKCEELDAEVKRLRDELKQAHHFLRDIRDGWLVDRDWIYINEYLGDEEE
tara:strand:+ start:2426 stop:2752 length:327 start_codon:yes stop_codon:yes gene_type:complete